MGIGHRSADSGNLLARLAFLFQWNRGGRPSLALKEIDNDDEYRDCNYDHSRDFLSNIIFRLCPPLVLWAGPKLWVSSGPARPL